MTVCSSGVRFFVRLSYKCGCSCCKPVITINNPLARLSGLNQAYSGVHPGTVHKVPRFLVECQPGFPLPDHHPRHRTKYGTSAPDLLVSHTTEKMIRSTLLTSSCKNSIYAAFSSLTSSSTSSPSTVQLGSPSHPSTSSSSSMLPAAEKSSWVASSRSDQTSETSRPKRQELTYSSRPPVRSERDARCPAAV